MTGQLNQVSNNSRQRNELSDDDELLTFDIKWKLKILWNMPKSTIV